MAGFLGGFLLFHPGNSGARGAAGRRRQRQQDRPIFGSLLAPGLSLKGETELEARRLLERRREEELISTP